MRLSLKVNNGYDFVYNYLSIDNRQPSTECSLFYNFLRTESVAVRS